MARRAAPYTSEQGNWRFGKFVLAINQDKILWIDLIDTSKEDPNRKLQRRREW
jgi:hypothetical protein